MPPVQHNESVILKALVTGYRDRRGDATVISGPLDIALNQGELTCLLGPNGAGKSTLLKTLCGFITPLSGEIIIDGRSLADHSSRELARTVGVVLTDRVSTGAMTVGQLVAMGRSPFTGFWGTISGVDRKAVDRSLALVGIEELSARMIDSLSDGERQKAMIAKALAQETPVILLDEPTAFLDYPSKVEIMRLLRRLAHDENRTIFISTHDIEIALRTSDRAWLLDKRLGLSAGSSADLLSSGKLKSYFDPDGSLGLEFRI